MADISVPTFIWHGTEDLFVPFGHGEFLAANVPGSTVHLIAGQGHLSLAIGAIDTMLTELVEVE